MTELGIVVIIKQEFVSEIVIAVIYRNLSLGFKEFVSELVFAVIIQQEFVSEFYIAVINRNFE